ncbi:Glyoxalase/Bleomycin resistance protein/Dioxygenase superfamily protein [Terriglobus roseus]|uniref:Glyoxalase/Bleomycin resistance protein/Dioxygenase superfamily protein n=2 Tax=Terriglobus roseus TaxID=392734 RepID=A0A1G7N6J3_9BACT|nr:Glyoxalase/Bleomycin resistance protein/Dioxygenase superfamily protein [Terriglobus roseus]
MSLRHCAYSNRFVLTARFVGPTLAGDMKTRVFVAVFAGMVWAFLLSACAQQKRPAITGIAFARFYASDPAASQHFYGDTVGLKKMSEGARSVYPVNASQWVEWVPLTDPSLHSRMAAIGFTTRDAKALQRYLTEHHVAIAEPLKDGMFAVHDPDGYLVYFVQTGSNRAVAKAAPSANATSSRIIHVGHVVRDKAAEDAFYRELLGFKPYWHGGRTDGRDDWVSSQVPDGTDWIEYMLHIPAEASLKSVGVQDHFSLGTENMDTVVAKLKANGCTDAVCSKTQIGLDGKMQLNLYDPDLSRLEYMEFSPRRKPCCSDFTGPQPTAIENK